MAKTTFLIYEGEDKDFVRFFQAETKLKDKEIQTRCMPNPKNLTGAPADKYKKKIEEQIKKADIAVVLIGKNTYRNKWVEWEIETAAKLAKPLLGVKIHGSWSDTVPVALENHGALISSIDYKDMTSSVLKTFDQIKTYSYRSGTKAPKYPTSGKRTVDDKKPDVQGLK